MSETIYKKITDVEQVAALKDTTTMFVNDNGALKQLPVADVLATNEQIAELTEEIDELKESGGTGGNGADEVVRELLEVAGGSTSKNLNTTKYETKTKSGVTFTVQEDNSIALSGTPTQDVWLFAGSQTAGSRVFLPAGTYTLSGYVDYVIGAQMQIFGSLNLYETNEATTVVKTYYSGKDPLTFTTDRDLWFYVNVCVSGTAGVVDGYVIALQVEEGTQATAYVSPWNSGETVRSKRLDDIEAGMGKTAAYMMDSPLDRIDTSYMFLPVFHNVGCIGDSLASGEAVYKENGSSKYIDLLEHSWGQYLARATGNTYYNFSRGGLTAKTWLEQQAAQAFDGTKKCEAYIIGLGVNDNLQGVTLGTASDINTSDYTQNADSFYGNYGKIIQKIKEHQPKAKVFVITAPDYGVENYGINGAVRDMSEIFDNVYVLDLYAKRTMFSAGFIKNQSRGGHYNAIGYKYISAIIGSYIDWYMYNHSAEFEQVEFIGTDYEWTD